MGFYFGLGKKAVKTDGTAHSPKHRHIHTHTHTHTHTDTELEGGLIWNEQIDCQVRL